MCKTRMDCAVYLVNNTVASCEVLSMANNGYYLRGFFAMLGLVKKSLVCGRMDGYDSIGVTTFEIDRNTLLPA